MSGEKSEVAPVGPNIDEAHARKQNGPDNRGLLRLILSGEANFLGDCVSQIATIRGTPEFRWHMHEEGKRRFPT